MKRLLLDIETAPNLAYCWGLWKEIIGSNQIVNSGYVMSFAAKWYGESGIMFESFAKSSHERVIKRAHTLLSEADVVIHYNGLSFDIPTLNKEFILAGLKPPSPYKQVDLLRVIRDKFRFPSNKLDYVSQTLDTGEKVRHEGFELWIKCMAKDAEAWKKMEKYNKHDVVLLERLYERVLPWIDRHPNLSIASGLLCCPNCGSKQAQHRGYARNARATYARLQCTDCGRWYRSSEAVDREGTNAAVGL